MWLFVVEGGGHVVVSYSLLARGGRGGGEGEERGGEGEEREGEGRGEDRVGMYVHLLVASPLKRSLMGRKSSLKRESER